MIEFLAEFWQYLRVRKRFWLIPIIVVFLVFAGLLAVTGSSTLAPFIYPLF